MLSTLEGFKNLKGGQCACMLGGRNQALWVGRASDEEEPGEGHLWKFELDL